jgi:hypothetical protein
MEFLKHWRYVCLEAKTSYQRNMVIAMGMVYALLLAILVAFVFWSPSVPSTSTTPFNQTVTRIQPKSLTDVPAAAAKGTRADNSGGLASIMRMLGHNSREITVVRDRASTPDIAELPEITPPGPLKGVGPIVLSDSADFTDDEFMPFSGGDGGSDLFGLGDNTFGLPNGIYIPPAVLPTDDEKYRTDLAENAPLYLGLAVPEFPSLADPNDTGIVIVDITVDRDGYVSHDIRLIHPPARGFGAALEWAIQKGKFFPRIVSGYKVTHTIRLTLVMTRTQNPHASKPETDFTYSTPDVTPVWLIEK